MKLDITNLQFLVIILDISPFSDTDTILLSFLTNGSKGDQVILDLVVSPVSGSGICWILKVSNIQDTGFRLYWISDLLDIKIYWTSRFYWYSSYTGFKVILAFKDSQDTKVTGFQGNDGNDGLDGQPGQQGQRHKVLLDFKDLGV